MVQLVKGVVNDPPACDCQTYCSSSLCCAPRRQAHVRTLAEGEMFQVVKGTVNDTPVCISQTCLLVIELLRAPPGQAHVNFFAGG